MEEKAPTTHSPTHDSNGDKTPPSVATAVLNSLSNISDRHGARILTWATVVQAVTALLMLVTILLGWRALVLSQRQFESTIDPVLEISYSPPPVLNLSSNITKQAFTNYYIGIPIENIIAMPDGALTNFNFTKATFKNIGCVSVSRLEIFMTLEAAFNKEGRVTNFFFTRLTRPLARSLESNEFIAHDFGDDPILKSLLENPQERRGRAVCFVIRYQRTVDMRPKFKMIIFVPMKLSPEGERPFAMPVDYNHRYDSHAEDGDIPYAAKVKTEVKEILRRMDISVSVD